MPIRGAGRFSHEAVAWLDGILYETEDRTNNAAFYRYVPDGRVRRSGDLAESTGTLQALRLTGFPNRNTDKGFPIGEPFDVEWVDIDEPEPDTDTVRVEAQSKGAAAFDRQEGAWVGNGKVFFDCTSGGDADSGQIFEYDPDEETLTLIYESPGPEVLEGPDNLVIVPKTRDIFLCEDASPPQFVRGVTQEGEIYDFAQSITNETEFCGACFSPDGQTLFLNQQGEAGDSGVDGVTYAIWGPFNRRRRGGGSRTILARLLPFYPRGRHTPPRPSSSSATRLPRSPDFKQQFTPRKQRALVPLLPFIARRTSRSGRCRELRNEEEPADAPPVFTGRTGGVGRTAS